MGHIRDNSIMAAIGRVEARLSRKPVLVIGKREGRARQVIAQLRHLNLRFRVEANLYEGLKELSIDADGWSLAILVADDIGGLPVARRSCDWLRSAAVGLPSIITGSDAPALARPVTLVDDGPVMVRLPISAPVIAQAMSQALDKVPQAPYIAVA
jgi:hypothetical protein